MKKMVCMSFETGLWKNVHLMKDCGLVPYYFHKLYGYKAVMVGGKCDTYSYLDSWVKGLQMDILAEDTMEARLEYVIEYANEIDILMLIGAYQPNLVFAKQYKTINPNGKVYLQLDMNSTFGEWIFEAVPELINLREYCDVIATSCRAVQRQMNIKLPWCVEYIANGFFDGFFDEMIPDYEEKRNVILTVSRLGAWVKATEILLEAFALVMNELPDWELHLVGGFSDGFEERVNEYYEKYPGFRERVFFLGEINDKKQLIEQYQQAKVFALPSRVEGGTPNVISEALRCGCVMAVTQFDAYEDIVDDGRCGMSSEIDDIEGYAEVLLHLCKNSELKKMSEAAYKNAIDNYDYRKIVRVLHMLLYGE